MMGDLLRRGFRRNQRILHAQAEGLSHEQSLTQTEYNVNCFNWVLGHVVSGRSQLLVRLFGVEPIMSEEQAARYLRESDPITEDGPGVMAFADLLGLLDASEEALEAALTDVDDEFMAEELSVEDGRMASRAAQVMFTYFHDTYHIGQTDLLRQMAGFSDKII
ncbi:MAG: DinB family protein [Acidobacteria bacterium]|nr:DinB family protein [Acidobacteriota bacterium]